MLKKIPSSFLLCFLLLAFISACKSCEKVIDCPGFPSEQLNLIPPFNLEKIEFTDSSGNVITFNTNSSYSTEATQRTCRTSFPSPPCECYENPSASYRAATNDTTWTKWNSSGTYSQFFKYLYYAADFRGTNRYQITCGILDAELNFFKESTIELTNNDQLLANFEIGGNVYKDVIFHLIDTAANNKNAIRGITEDFVQEMYYTTTQRLIAFKDLKTKRYYFLK